MTRYVIATLVCMLIAPAQAETVEPDGMSETSGASSRDDVFIGADDTPLPLDICDIPQRECSKYPLRRTMLDIWALTRGLVGYDYIDHPQLPPVHSSGLLETVGLWAHAINRDSPPNPALSQLERLIEEALDLSRMIHLEAEVDHTFDVDDLRTTLSNVECVFPSLLAKIESLRDELDRMGTTLQTDATKRHWGYLREDVAQVYEVLLYLEALLRMQTEACAADMP
jgi:hypothetical protein